MKGGRLDTLARPARSSGNGSFNRIVKVFVSGRHYRVGDSGEGLAEKITFHPALERSEAVGCAHRLAAMKPEPVAQGEAVEKPVR